MSLIRSDFVSRPRYLLLHLKRFIFVEQPISSALENQEPNSPSRPNAVEYIFKKNKAPVSIPRSLPIDHFLAQGVVEESNYNLQSVVHHIGRQASSGHYTAASIRNAMDPTGEKAQVWVNFDDSNSGRSTFQSVTQGKKASTAYLLLYELNGEVATDVVSEATAAGAKPPIPTSADHEKDVVEATTHLWRR